MRQPLDVGKLWREFSADSDHCVDVSPYDTCYFRYAKSFAENEPEILNRPAFLQFFPEPNLELEDFLEWNLQDYVEPDFSGTLSSWFDKIGSAADRLLWRCILENLFLYQPLGKTIDFLKRSYYENLLVEE